MKAFSSEIYQYWSGRANGYSEYNQKELGDERRDNWKQVLTELIDRYTHGKSRDQVQILDAGTGPGFFAILLAEEGYSVTAIDSTEAMLREARKNAGPLSQRISWVLGDVQDMDFHSERFDIIVTRNVTWNLPDPARAYEEWFRVLKPTGVLLNFDADWYGYLVDEEKREAYEQDRKNSADQNREDCNVGEHFDVMENLARRMPLTEKSRPQWDIEQAGLTGFHEVICDEEIWKIVWSEDEKISCASTPQFLLIAQKQDPKERVIQYWAKRSENFSSLKHREMHADIGERWMQHIRPELPKGKKLRILDVGCGAGFFSILLAKEGHEVIGVDLTPEMIQRAKELAEQEQVAPRFMVMDAEKIDFPDESFDVVISRNLTWTLPHPDVAYINWMRVLKKGGVLLNFDADYAKEYEEKGYFLPENHAHKNIGVEMHTENDAIMSLMSISYHRRPVWDVKFLLAIGVNQISIDNGISDRIYLEVDEFFNPVPMFRLKAVKE